MLLFFYPDLVLEVQVASADNYASSTSAGSPGGENLHRQVGFIYAPVAEALLLLIEEWNAAEMLLCVSPPEALRMNLRSWSFFSTAH